MDLISSMRRQVATAMRHTLHCNSTSAHGCGSSGPSAKTRSNYAIFSRKEGPFHPGQWLASERKGSRRNRLFLAGTPAVH